MRFNTFFFDLDDTLYPPGSGLWAEIGTRINSYLCNRLGFPPEQVEIREKYFREYGTTLRGLQANHAVDMDEYLAYVHDVPLTPHLSPDPALRAAIEQIRARKFIFTNADRNYASRVLDALGLQGLFDGIIDVHTIAPHCKPMPEAFELALQAAGSPAARNCVLFDDQARITRAGRALGMYTVLVGKDEPGFAADEALVNLRDLPALIQYWRL